MCLEAEAEAVFEAEEVQLGRCGGLASACSSATSRSTSEPAAGGAVVAGGMAAIARVMRPQSPCFTGFVIIVEAGERSPVSMLT